MVTNERSPTQRGGLLGFLTTVPGVITALAGLITAIVGLLQVPFDSTPPDDHTPSPQPVIVITPDPVPVENPAPEQLDVTEATTVSNVDVGSDVEQLIDACASGDPDACADVLDLATQGCYEGYAATCDFLYEVTEVGSDLEAYGATCGGRVDSWDYAGRCAGL